MGRYKIKYQRDESGWWYASAKDVPGCHTQGRTIQEAERRIREALSLFVDDAETAELIRDVQLPDDLNAALTKYQRAREDLENAQIATKEIAEEVAATLSQRLNLSVRDMTNFLDLSHQRIQQIVASTRPSKKEKAPKRGRKKCVAGLTEHVVEPE